MLVYIFIFIYLTFLAFLSLFFEDKKSELKFFIFPTFILFLVIDGFRKSSVGSDLHVYVSIFEKNALKLPGFSNFFKSRFESGYILSNQIIRSLTNQYTVFLFIFAIITLLIWFYVLSKYSKNIYISLMIYFSSFGMFLYSFSNIRQGLAVAIGFLGFYFLFEKKNIRGIICILLAPMFHSSGVICILFLLLKNVKLNYKHYSVLLLITLALLPFTKILFATIISVFPQYISYLESSWFIESNKWAPVLLTILYGLIFVFGELVMKNQLLTKREEAIKTLFFINLILTMTTLQTALLERFVFYISPIVTLYIPMVLYKITEKKLRWILFYVTVIIYFVILLVFIYFKPEWYQIVPYRSVITDWLIGN